MFKTRKRVLLSKARKRLGLGEPVASALSWKEAAFFDHFNWKWSVNGRRANYSTISAKNGA